MTSYGSKSGDFDTMEAMHKEQVKTLMRSISSLKSQVERLQGAQRDSKRSEYIQRLTRQLRHQDTVNEILRRALMDHSGMSPSEIDELVLQKTIGDAKRVQPVTREELSLKLTETQRKLKSTLKKVDSLKQKNTELSNALAQQVQSAVGITSPARTLTNTLQSASQATFEQTSSPALQRNHNAASMESILPTPYHGLSTPLKFPATNGLLNSGVTTMPARNGNASHAHQVLTGSGPAEAMRSELAAQTSLVQEQQIELDELNEEIVRLRRIRDQYTRVAEKYDDMKREVRELRAERKKQTRGQATTTVEMTRLQDEVESMQLALTSAEKALQNERIQVERLQTTNAGLEESYSHAQSRIKEQRQRLLSQDSTIDDLTDKVSQLEKRQSNLTEKLESKTKLMEESDTNVQALQMTKTKLEAHVQEVESVRDTLQEQLDETSNTLQQTREKVSTLTKQLDSLQTTHADLSKEKDDLKRQLNSTLETLKSLQDDMDTHSATSKHQVHQLKQQRDTLLQEKTSLINRLNDLRTEHEALEQQNKSLQLELQNVRNNLQNAQEEAQSVRMLSSTAPGVANEDQLAKMRQTLYEKTQEYADKTNQYQTRLAEVENALTRIDQAIDGSAVQLEQQEIADALQNLAQALDKAVDVAKTPISIPTMDQLAISASDQQMQRKLSIEQDNCKYLSRALDDLHLVAEQWQVVGCTLHDRLVKLGRIYDKALKDLAGPSITPRQQGSIYHDIAVAVGSTTSNIPVMPNFVPQAKEMARLFTTMTEKDSDDIHPHQNVQTGLAQAKSPFRENITVSPVPTSFRDSMNNQTENPSWTQYVSDRELSQGSRSRTAPGTQGVTYHVSNTIDVSNTSTHNTNAPNTNAHYPSHVQWFHSSWQATSSDYRSVDVNQSTANLQNANIQNGQADPNRVHSRPNFSNTMALTQVVDNRHAHWSDIADTRARSTYTDVAAHAAHDNSTSHGNVDTQRPSNTVGSREKNGMIHGRSYYSSLGATTPVAANSARLSDHPRDSNRATVHHSSPLRTAKNHDIGSSQELSPGDATQVDNTANQTPVARQHTGATGSQVSSDGPSVAASVMSNGGSSGSYLSGHRSGIGRGVSPQSHGRYVYPNADSSRAPFTHSGSVNSILIQSDDVSVGASNYGTRSTHASLTRSFHTQAPDSASTTSNMRHTLPEEISSFVIGSSPPSHSDNVIADASISGSNIPLQSDHLSSHGLHTSTLGNDNSMTPTSAPMNYMHPGRANRSYGGAASSRLATITSDSTINTQSVNDSGAGVSATSDATSGRAFVSDPSVSPMAGRHAPKDNQNTDTHHDLSSQHEPAMDAMNRRHSSDVHANQPLRTSTLTESPEPEP